MIVVLRIAAPAAVVAALGVLASGCGGSSHAPSVASLGPTNSTTTTSTGSASTGGGSKRGVGMRFASCMRSHGVTNFPDPDSRGGLSISSASGIDPSSHQFQSAQRACQKLLPVGGASSPAQLASMRSQLLRFASCMRSHGLANFPDPQISTSGGFYSVRIQGGPGSGLDKNSPAFQRATLACRRFLPGGGQGLRTQSAAPGKGSTGR